MSAVTFLCFVEVKMFLFLIDNQTGSRIKHEHDDGSVHIMRRSERQAMLAPSQKVQIASAQQQQNAQGEACKVSVVLR